MSRLPAHQGRPHHESHPRDGGGDHSRAVDRLAEIVEEVRAEQRGQGERMAAMQRDQAAMARDLERTAEILDRVADKVSDHGNRLVRAETVGERESRDNASRDRRQRFLENKWNKAAAALGVVVFLITNLTVIAAAVRFLAGGGAP